MALFCFLFRFSILHSYSSSKIKIGHRTVSNGHIQVGKKDRKTVSFPRWKQDSKTFHLEQDSTEIIAYAERSNLQQDRWNPKHNRTDRIPDGTRQVASQIDQDSKNSK